MLILYNYLTNQRCLHYFSLNFMKKHLPNTLTSFNLLCGWASIYFCFEASYVLAIFLIAFASIFDFLDGFVAKRLNVQSELGEQLDSFADLVTFGVAPAVLIYNVSVGHFVFVNSIYQIFLYLVIGLIPVCGAIRLAKFNINKEKTNDFIGLPIPAFALITLSLTYLFLYYLKMVSLIPNYPFWYVSFIIFCSFLMVGKLKFISFKFESFSFNENKIRYLFLISSLFVFLLILIIGYPVLISPIIIILYIVFSIFNNFKKES